MTEKTKKWSDEAIARLMSAVGAQRPVSPAKVEAAAAELEFTTRSVASKLRQMDIEVASMAVAKTATFSEQQTQDLKDFVSRKAGSLTYKEIAEKFAGGMFTPKQIQGKLLALEMTDKVKPAEKVEVARTYSEVEEAKFVKLANSGHFIEEIAEALNKTIASVRGKALSLTRNGLISKIPAQRESHATSAVDPVVALGDKIHQMTVAEIAAAVDKTERGIKTLLTRRGLTVADYDGKAKKEKAEAKQAA